MNSFFGNKCMNIRIISIAVVAVISPLTCNAQQDIRSVPLPLPASSIQSFGYSAAINSEMLANPSDLRWAARPPLSWTPSTDALRSRMTQAISSTYGMPAGLATTVINMCKVYARDPYHCVVYASAVMCAESTCGNIFSNGIFGVQISNPSTKSEAIFKWIQTYNQKWYSANEGYHYGFCKYPNPSAGHLKYCDNSGNDFSTAFFYSYVPTLMPFSHYCLSESGSGTYCPNGYNNSKVAYLRVR
jgi:hypothetical protein